MKRHIYLLTFIISGLVGSCVNDDSSLKPATSSKLIKFIDWAKDSKSFFVLWADSNHTTKAVTYFPSEYDLEGKRINNYPALQDVPSEVRKFFISADRTTIVVLCYYGDTYHICLYRITTGSQFSTIDDQFIAARSRLTDTYITAAPSQLWRSTDPVDVNRCIIDKSGMRILNSTKTASTLMPLSFVGENEQLVLGDTLPDGSSVYKTFDDALNPIDTAILPLNFTGLSETVFASRTPYLYHSYSTPMLRFNYRTGETLMTFVHKVERWQIDISNNGDLLCYIPYGCKGMFTVNTSTNQMIQLVEHKQNYIMLDPHISPDDRYAAYILSNNRNYDLVHIPSVVRLR